MHLTLVLIASLLALLAGVSVLYAQGDWILLGLVIIVLVGLVLVLQRSLPGYINEARLLLNIGPVREGERIIYHGLPWRVQTLRMQADEPGIYTGQCTEFCGLSHARMRQAAVALNTADFQTWVTNQLAAYADNAPEPGTLAATGEGTFINQCARCHQMPKATKPRPRSVSANGNIKLS